MIKFYMLIVRVLIVYMFIFHVFMVYVLIVHVIVFILMRREAMKQIVSREAKTCKA